MTSNPLEDHSLDGYRLFPVAAREAHPRRAAGIGPGCQEHEPLQELLRSGHVLLALQPPMEHTYAWLDDKFKNQAAAGRSQQARHESRLQLLRGHRGLPGQLRDSAGQARSRHLPQSQRQSGPGHGIRGGRPARPGCRCSSAPIRSRRLPTFFTSCPATRISASSPFRPKTKSPPSLPPSARPIGGSLALTTTSGPGMALKTEAMGLAIMPSSCPW
jgi:2-oxoglutarate ferredoxin oxidoreductase subunit alpha